MHAAPSWFKRIRGSRNQELVVFNNCGLFVVKIPGSCCSGCFVLQVFCAWGRPCFRCGEWGWVNRVSQNSKKVCWASAEPRLGLQREGLGALSIHNCFSQTHFWDFLTFKTLILSWTSPILEAVMSHEETKQLVSIPAHPSPKLPHHTMVLG